MPLLSGWTFFISMRVASLLPFPPLSLLTGLTLGNFFKISIITIPSLGLVFSHSAYGSFGELGKLTYLKITLLFLSLPKIILKLLNSPTLIIPTTPQLVFLSLSLGCPSPRSSFKLNTDGFSLGNYGNGGTGGIVKNSNGDWVVGFFQHFPHATNNLMKLLALIKHLKLVLEHQLLPIKINIDSKEVILMLKQGNLLYNPLLHECMLLLNKLRSILVHHCYKKQNMVEDALGKFGARMEALDNCKVADHACLKINREKTLSAKPLYSLI